MSRLSLAEICAGAGGQSLGLHLAGFTHTVAVEIDPTAAWTLKTNLGRLAEEAGERPPLIAIGDVANESVWKPQDHKVDLLAGGVPCPPFSIAGKQLGTKDERDLYMWAVKQVEVMQPNALMLENVRGLSMPRFSGYRQEVLDFLDLNGYTAFWRLLEARDYGVPQLRPRFVLVALKKKYAKFFEWPAPRPTTETVGTTLRDLMGARGWRHLDRWVERANDIAPTIVGGSKKHGGADLGPTRAKQAWLALGVDGFGVADEAPTGDDEPERGPKLTTEMVARLQGWIGDEYNWHFEGRKTSRYRQIGNAFPPPVARAVGTAIANALAEIPTSAMLAVTDPHDPVFRVLRDRNDFVSITELTDILSPSLTRREIERRIQHLEHDFDLAFTDVMSERAWKLGEFRGFQGQVDHHRHAAFAAPAARGRIS